MLPTVSESSGCEANRGGVEISREALAGASHEAPRSLRSSLLLAFVGWSQPGSCGYAWGGMTPNCCSMPRAS